MPNPLIPMSYRPCLSLGLVLILFSSGCRQQSLPPGSTLSPSPSGTPGSPTGQATPPPASPQPLPGSPRPKALDTVTIYWVDSQCETLVPETITVPANQPLVSAVGQIIDRLSTADFELTGYRVNLDPAQQQATIDFRLTPGTQRGFTSLSTCERLALFGSLNKTLTSNPDWAIKTVRFTQQGQLLDDF